MLVFLSVYPHAITRELAKEISRNPTRKSKVVSLNGWFQTLWEWVVPLFSKVSSLGCLYLQK